MGRARRCAICASDPAITSQVNAQIEAGCKQKLIHEQFPQFSISKLSRHGRFCLASKSAPELVNEAGSAKHAKWLERAESTFLTAQANGDTKSAAAAISVAVRALTAMHKKQAEEVEASKAVADDRYSIQAIDQTLKDFMAELDAKNGGIATKAACLTHEESRFGELVLAIWNNRALLPVLLNASMNYLPERVTEHVNAND